MAKTILLAEDDSQIREMIEDDFTRNSSGELQLISAKDGSEALAETECDTAPVSDGKGS